MAPSPSDDRMLGHLVGWASFPREPYAFDPSARFVRVAMAPPSRVAYLNPPLATPWTAFRSRKNIPTNFESTSAT